MSTAVAQTDPQAGGERLVLTIIFSALLHGVILLGVGFSAARPASAPPMLDVILVATATEQEPDHADFLAQASQEGGGDLDEAARPTAPGSAATIQTDPGQAEAIQDMAAPQVRAQDDTPVIVTRADSDSTASTELEQNEPEPTVPHADQLQELQREIAALAAEQAERQQNYARRPRKKFISAQTREYFYASYMRAWDARIERLSNQEYPALFARHGLHGDLIMTVEVNRDGSVASIEIIDPSPHRLLDDTAIQIVRRAAPFLPLPSNPDERIDILHITRTWQFLPSGEVRQR